MTWGIPPVPALLLLSAPAWFTFHTAYLDGLEAQGRGDHALAARAFGRAIELEPRPGSQVKTYGLNFLPTYHPYVHLAESLLAVGDAAGAERALALSDRFGIEPPAARDALRKRLQVRASPAKAAPPAPAPLQNPVPASLPTAPARAPETPLQTPPPATRPPAPVPDALPVPARPLPAKSAPAAAPPRPRPLPQAGPTPPDAVKPRIASRPWALGGTVSAAVLALALFLRRRRRPHGDQPTQGSDPNLGRGFGPYRALRLLGEGGCASAYYGVHRKTGVPVALKVPHRHLAQDPLFRARFRREAALGARLHHPRIVPILTPDPPEEDLWIAMTFIKGITLEAFIRLKGPLPIPWTVTIATHVAQAIAHAHEKNVVHRDLKPANIMLNEEGAWVMDFGVARVLDGTATSSTMFIGTPSYAAPECLLNPQVGPEADGYALGLILFEMLTGRQAFTGSSAFQILEAHRTGAPPDVRSLRPETPEGLSVLVDRLCRKAPGERPGDPEILAALEALAPISSWPPPSGALPA